MWDDTGSPIALPAAQRYAVVSAPFSNRSISFCTPRATTTQTRPAASPARLVAEPVSDGVRSTGVPPAAGTVHTWSGVRTLVVVLRKARVRPPSVHAIPLTALGTSAARRDPFGPQTSIVEARSLKPILGVWDTNATVAESRDQAIAPPAMGPSAIRVNDGHHQAPLVPSTFTTYRLVRSGSTTVRTSSSGF